LLKGELAFLSKGVVLGGLTGLALFVFCVVSLVAAVEATLALAFARVGGRMGVFFASADFFSDLFFMFAGQIHHPQAQYRLLRRGHAIGNISSFKKQFALSFADDFPLPWWQISKRESADCNAD